MILPEARPRILPPTSLSEFLIFRASFSPEYEVFSFTVPIHQVLEMLGRGEGLGESIINESKSYTFLSESREETESRAQLKSWLKSCGISDYDKLGNLCSSWRLIHANTTSRHEIPNYQGHPIQEHDWVREPSAIKRHKERVDVFDPLSQIVETFAFYN